MEPKLKAEELVRKYYTFGLNNPAQSFSWYECKECSLIAVDEIIKEIYLDQYYSQKRIIYYEAVKQEIEKL